MDALQEKIRNIIIPEVLKLCIWKEFPQSYVVCIAHGRNLFVLLSEIKNFCQASQMKSTLFENGGKLNLVVNF